VVCVASVLSAAGCSHVHEYTYTPPPPRPPTIVERGLCPAGAAPASAPLHTWADADPVRIPNGGVASTDETLAWVTTHDEELVEIDLATGAVRQTWSDNLEPLVAIGDELLAHVADEGCERIVGLEGPNVVFVSDPVPNPKGHVIKMSNARVRAGVLQVDTDATAVSLVRGASTSGTLSVDLGTGAVQAVTYPATQDIAQFIAEHPVAPPASQPHFERAGYKTADNPLDAAHAYLFSCPPDSEIYGTGSPGWREGQGPAPGERPHCQWIVLDTSGVQVATFADPSVYGGLGGAGFNVLAGHVLYVLQGPGRSSEFDDPCEASTQTLVAVDATGQTVWSIDLATKVTCSGRRWDP
jgi:hypothetical protein